MLSFTLSGKTYTWTTNNIDRHKLNRILDLFHIISCIMFFASFLYFHVHFLSCSYIVHVSYTFISRILSYKPSYIVLYFLSIFLCFSYTVLLYVLIWYFACTVLPYVFYLLYSFSSFSSMTYYILCTITYIFS